MVYSRCLYQIVLFADANMRRVCMVTHGVLRTYVSHASFLLGGKILAMGIGGGCVQVLVDLDPGTSVSDFVTNLKAWSSAWIKDANKVELPDCSYWRKDCSLIAVSPEDKSSAIDLVSSMPADFDVMGAIFQGCFSAFSVISDVNYELPVESFRHHIIFITKGGKLSLPTKYRMLVARGMRLICINNGAADVVCSAMRNHVHALCRIPSHVSVGEFVESVKKGVMEWLESGRRLFGFDGWSEDYVAYTVSETRQTDETSDVMHQLQIHSPSRMPNEMSYIYRKLEIPFFVALH